MNSRSALNFGWALAFVLGLAVQADAALPAGCGAGKEVRQSGGLDSMTIAGALSQLVSPLGTDTCVVIRDTQTYSEQVTVKNFAFTYSTNTLRITADPSFISSAPAVNPPLASTAAFLVQNASVTIFNISVISTNSVPYGVYASSGYITISSVNVDSGGKIYNSGMSISSYSAILHSSITVQNANALVVAGSLNTILLSTITNSSAGNVHAFLLSGTSNSISQCFISFKNSGNGNALSISNGINNTINRSSVTALGINSDGIYFSGGSSNTITQSFLYTPGNGTAKALFFDQNANANTVANSTMSSGVTGVHMFNASSNTVTQSLVSVFGGYGALIDNSSDHNTISQSTVTCTTGSVYQCLWINGAQYTTIVNSFVQSSSVIYVSDSTGTVIGGSVLVALTADRSALWLTGGNVNLSVTSTTLKGGSSGAGLLMDKGTSGSVILTSNTITGGKYGVSIATMGFCGTCSGNLSITSMTFSGGLTAGATAINFAGGSFISTFTAVAYDDANISINVNARRLSSASRIAMRSNAGIKSGSVFENDPLDIVDWGGSVNPAPTNPLASGVFLSSVTVSFGTVGAVQYVVEASTAADFTGTLFTAVGAAAPLDIITLARNITYYLRAGALWGAATSYANTTPAFEVTLASSPAPLNFTGITPNQFTVNWHANSNPVTTNYEVTISTKVDFSLISSSLTTTALTTLFTTLLPQTTYFARVRAVNGAGVPSAYALGAVVTTNGVITISANRLTSTWYGTTDTVFNAQGATNFHYAINTDPTYVPNNGDLSFDGSALPVILPQGIVYFHVTGDNGGASVGTAHFGPLFIDLAAPVVPSIAAQVSATNITPVPDGTTLFSPTPHITWTAPTNTASPIVGYSVSLSSEPTDQPALLATTILTFTDFVLTQPYAWYVKVRAQNQAGTWGTSTGLSFTYSVVPTASDIILRKNYFNPLRGECTSISVQVATSGHLTAKLYNLLGQLVANWIDQDVGPGSFNYSWCGRTASGASVATGSYLLHVEAPQQKKNFYVVIVK